MTIFFLIVLILTLLGFIVIVINPNSYNHMDVRHPPSYQRRASDFPKLQEGQDWKYYNDFPRSALTANQLKSQDEIMKRALSERSDSEFLYALTMYELTDMERINLKNIVIDILLNDNSVNKKNFSGECVDCVSQELKGINRCFNCSNFSHNDYHNFLNLKII